MNPIQNILLSNIYIVLIYLVYRILFSQTQHFGANRAFLVTGTLTALLLPWISPVMEWLRPAEEIAWMAAVPAVPMDPAITTGQMLVEPINSMSTREIILWVYLAVVATILIINGFVWLNLLLSIRKAPRYRMGRLRVIVLDKGWSAFSYFSVVLYPKPFDPDSTESRLILEHESVHARQWHTLDNIFLGFFRLAFYFNPFIHLLHKELKITHEYLADRHTSGSDRSSYSRILISHQFKVPQLVLLHPFNKQSFLKRRLNMLMKSTHTRRTDWRYLFVLPLLGAMILSSSWNVTAQDQAVQKKNQLTAEVEKQLIKMGFTKTGYRTWSKDGLTIQAVDDSGAEEAKRKLKAAQEAEAQKMKSNGAGQVFQIVEEMPEFQGGDIEKFRGWVLAHAKYPAEAKESKISGTVFVTFHVNETGKVVNAQVLRGVHPSLDAEAVRVVQSSPEWKPGKQKGEAVTVSFSIPVRFELGEKAATTQLAAKKEQELSAKEKAEQEAIEEKMTFLIVEEMPQFQGGTLEDFFSWAHANVKYPALAMENSISGTVEVSFVVGRDGKVKNATVSKSVDPVLDEAALNVVNSSPVWTPGKQRGKNVNVAYKIPITFKLQ